MTTTNPTSTTDPLTPLDAGLMPTSQSLRELVASRVGRQWEAWAQSHPHLAAVVDRTRLVESAVNRLGEDPAFREALRQADLDEAHLAVALRVVEQIDRWLGRLLRL